MIYLLVDRQTRDEKEEEEEEEVAVEEKGKKTQVNRENRNAQIKKKTYIYRMDWQQPKFMYSFHFGNHSFLSSFLEAISIIDFDIQRT